jgi:hypothetical protein
MIDREKYIAQRNVEIDKHRKEMNNLLQNAKKIAELPTAKRWQTSIIRAAKIVQLSVLARMIYAQIQIIASQPIPKKELPKGGRINNGPAIVGEKE